MPEAGLMGFINPQSVKEIITGGVQLADLYLPVKINGDMALLKALELLLIEFEKNNPGKVFDNQFIEDKTTGYEEFLKQFDHYKLEELAELSGVSKEALRQAAEIIAFKNELSSAGEWGLPNSLMV